MAFARRSLAGLRSEVLFTCKYEKKAEVRYKIAIAGFIRREWHVSGSVSARFWCRPNGRDISNRCPASDRSEDVTVSLFPKERFARLIVVVSIAGIVALVAVLQYRWSRKLSEATSTLLQGNLHTAMLRFRQDVHRELAPLCVSLQLTGDDSQELTGELRRGFSTWKGAAAHPDLVSEVFLWQDAVGKHSRITHLNPLNDQLLEDSWPFALDSLRARLEKRSRLLLAVARWRNANTNQEPPGALPGAVDHKGSPPVFGWQIDENIPALVHPLLRHAAHSPTKFEIDWIIVKLNRKVLQSRVFPELAKRHFGGHDGLVYQVAVLVPDGHDVLFSSDKEFGKSDLGSFDAELSIFGPLRAMPPRTEMDIFRQPPSTRNDSGAINLNSPGGIGVTDPIRLEVIRHTPYERDWQLMVRNRLGSVATIVAAQHRRNLAESFGVLVLLTLSIIFILITSQRAQRLARLQIDLVASFSHELRTPLTVISSAAENLTDGVVGGKEQLAQYGRVIKRQARQLTDTVDQILAFASMRQRQPRYQLLPTRVSDVVTAALESMNEVLVAGHFRLEREIAPTLPSALGDPVALTQCLQNLIANAVKYSGEDHWIRVRALYAAEANEIQISVDDKGVGISTLDLAHIFEPFYRSSSAVSAQIHGTGLGLTVARSVAEAMGGRITVKSKPQQGSSFTLHLHVAPQPIHEAQTVSVSSDSRCLDQKV